MDWFLYDNGLRHERVNATCSLLCDSDQDYQGRNPFTLSTANHNLVKVIIVVS